MYIVHLSVNFDLITAPAPDFGQPLRTASAGSWVKSLDLVPSKRRKKLEEKRLQKGLGPRTCSWFFHGFSVRKSDS